MLGNSPSVQKSSQQSDKSLLPIQQASPFKTTERLRKKFNNNTAQETEFKKVFHFQRFELVTLICDKGIFIWRNIFFVYTICYLLVFSLH